MEWNQNGELQYYTNGTQIGRMNIDKGLVYFPCICRYGDFQKKTLKWWFICLHLCMIAKEFEKGIYI